MILDQYHQAVDDLFSRIRTTQRENIIKAGKMIADAVDKGGCVHICDSGHIIDSELIYRGGGLILYKALKYGLNVQDATRTRDKTGMNTSMEGLAAYALRASNVMPGDVIILGSVSGRTLAIVDMAYEARKMGVKLIAITSMSYATQVESPHSSGKKLYELADITLDNCAPAAEAMLEVEGLEPRLCAASGLSAAFIMWSITTVVVEELMKIGKTPGVLKSANFPGGNDYNKTYVEPRYEKEGL